MNTQKPDEMLEALEHQALDIEQAMIYEQEPTMQSLLGLSMVDISNTMMIITLQQEQKKLRNLTLLNSILVLILSIIILLK